MRINWSEIAALFKNKDSGDNKAGPASGAPTDEKGVSRWPAGTEGSKGGQFAPKGHGGAAGGDTGGDQKGGGTTPPEGGAKAPQKAGVKSWMGMTPEDVYRLIPKSEFDLSPEEQAVEERLARKIAADPEAAFAAYAKLPETHGGKVLNTDEARMLSDDYAASKEGRSKWALAVHEPASWVIKQLYSRALASKDTTGNGDGVITFLAGGGGSGKGSSYKVENISRLLADSQVIVDGVLDNAQKAGGKFKQAWDHGKRVVVAFVARDPVESFVEGVAKRAENSGRTVKAFVQTKQHEAARDAFKTVASQFEDRDDFMAVVVDNTRGMGNARVGSMQTVEGLNYDRARERVIEGTRRLRDAGKISEFTYRNLGIDELESELEGSMGVGRRGHGAHAQSVSKGGAGRPGLAGGVGNVDHFDVRCALIDLKAAMEVSKAVAGGKM